MAPDRSSRRLLSVVLLVLGLPLLVPPSADAQDRSVPRFGPLVNPDTVTAGPFDLGRIWSFAQPPLNYFTEEYDVQANERGLRHARLSTVRLPNCSGSLVSPQGLVLTADRCVRRVLPAGGDDSLRTSSFYAETLAEERALPELYAEQVVAVETVTQAVDSAAAAADGRSERDGAEVIEQRRQAEAAPNQRVEVVQEAGGTRYVAYTYRRYDDVRLAFVPDPAVTSSGALGMPLTYPQHAWDVAVLRIYQDDQPLETPQHFGVREQGVRPGDAVFAVGHPPSTRRAESHEQLAVRRDVVLPARHSVLTAATARVRQYVDTTRSASAKWSDRLAATERDLRQVRAQHEGLDNNYVMARLQSRDRELRRALAEDPRMASDGGSILDRVATLQKEKRALASDYRAFSFLMHPTHSSATLRRALFAYRVRVGDTTATASRPSMPDVREQPTALDAAALSDHLRHLRTHFAADSTLLRALPDPTLAASLVRNSLFSDPDPAQSRLQQGELPETDPAFEVVSAFYDRYTRFRRTWADLEAQERSLTDSLARVRHQAAEWPVAVPEERALRIADGRVQGYPYNGTFAPPFTTFYGLYERHHALRTAGSTSPLPRAWRGSGTTMGRSTPLTTVASTDLGRGAHGGPLLNTSLQLVGVVFDGNVQSATGQYLFLPDRMRTVAVDVRGALEGLSSVYGADRIVQEMTGGPPSQ